MYGNIDQPTIFVPAQGRWGMCFQNHISWKLKTVFKKNHLKFGVEFQKGQDDRHGLRALQALSLIRNFKSIIKRVCNYINLTLPWRRQSLPFEMQQFTHCIKDYKLKGRLKLSDNSLTVVMTYFFKFLISFCYLLRSVGKLLQVV